MKVADSIPFEATREREVLECFKNYKDNGGVLSEKIFDRSLKLFDETLSADRRGECRFITGAKSTELVCWHLTNFLIINRSFTNS